MVVTSNFKIHVLYRTVHTIRKTWCQNTTSTF